MNMSCTLGGECGLRGPPEFRLPPPPDLTCSGGILQAAGGSQALASHMPPPPCALRLQDMEFEEQQTFVTTIAVTCALLAFTLISVVFCLIWRFYVLPNSKGRKDVTKTVSEPTLVNHIGRAHFGCENHARMPHRPAMELCGGDSHDQHKKVCTTDISGSMGGDSLYDNIQSECGEKSSCCSEEGGVVQQHASADGSGTGNLLDQMWIQTRQNDSATGVSDKTTTSAACSSCSTPYYSELTQSGRESPVYAEPYQHLSRGACDVSSDLPCHVQPKNYYYGNNLHADNHSSLFDDEAVLDDKLVPYDISAVASCNVPKNTVVHSRDSNYSSQQPAGHPSQPGLWRTNSQVKEKQNKNSTAVYI